MGKLDFGLIEPARGAFAIVPSDANPLNQPTRGLYVGVTGDVIVEMVLGHVVTFTDLAEGIVHPMSVIRVYATGTTATNIVGVF